jgi:diguanylate cyclase (GGDEF)-like protein
MTGVLWFLSHRVTQIGALERLTKAAAPVGAHDPHRALEELAVRAIELFTCDGVELVVTSPTGRGWWVCTSSSSSPVSIRHTEVQPPPLPEESTVVEALSTQDRDLGHVSLVFDSRPRLHRDAKNVLRLFGQAASAAWSMVVAHQELMVEERERQAETQRRVHAQTHEPLTGLPNRTQLDSWVDSHLQAGRSVSIVLVTLSRFREVNEILGHQSGDALLREVAFRLRASVRGTDVVSRVDGAHFCVALVDVAGPHVTRLASDIQTRVGQPMSIDGLTIAVELTIGVAHGPSDASSADGLLRCAEVATGMAQREGVSTLAYDPSQEQGSIDDLQLMTELADAVDRDELILHYQPKVDLRTGRITGAEALVRWQHPARGLLSPVAFVGHLERSSLLIPVTLHLVERALIDLRGWPERDGEPYTVAVNLGARCLLDAGLPDALERLCLRHGIPTSRLVLEITESIAVSPLPVASQVLDGLRDRGFAISVDDFGTGFSSLTFLHRHKVSELKIDRSFVSQVAHEESARAIVGAAVALAHDLGMKAVAEGIETREQMAALQALGVDLAQGYLMAKPMAPHALEGHLASTPVDPHVIDVTDLEDMAETTTR